MPAAAVLLVGGQTLGALFAVLALATVLHGWIPQFYDYGLNLHTLRAALRVPRAFVLLLAMSQACVVLCVVLAARASGRPLRERDADRERAAHREDHPRELARGQAAAVQSEALARGLQALGGLPEIGNPRRELVTLLLMSSPVTKVAFVLSGSLLAAASEELVFRGWLQRRLLASWRPAVAIAVTSVLFAIAHGDAAYAVYVLPAGILAGYLAWRADSIRVTFVCHASVNAAGQATLAFFGDRMLAAAGGAPPALARPAHDAVTTALVLLAGALLVAAGVARTERCVRQAPC